MTGQFHCMSPRRRDAVKDATDSLGHPLLNGIDYLEVSESQTLLDVYFIHNLPGEIDGVPSDPPQPLTRDQVMITGGVRVTSFDIEDVATSGNRLSVTVKEPGDFSTYTLRLVRSPTDHAAPAGFDPRLSEVDFSFKVGCAGPFDCKIETSCPRPAPSAPLIDYLNKDYQGFRRLMFDRLAVIMPEWKERNAADLGVALVEILAYAADHLSYYQDAVATEAYLGTARRRVSVRRHARLLDYHVHEGCNARVWAAIEVEKSAVEGKVLPGSSKNRPGTCLFTRMPGLRTVVTTPPAFERGVRVFETLHDIALWSDHNEMLFYPWSDAACCLPQGATQATLQGHLPNLKVGDVLILEEKRGPQTGRDIDADPDHRQAVRLSRVTAYQDGQPLNDPLTGDPVTEIEWHHEDSLQFPLCISSQVGGVSVDDVSVARGNIVLADHGVTRVDQELQPNEVPASGRYSPRLPYSGLTHAGSYDHEAAASLSAVSTLRVSTVTPSITVKGTDLAWYATRDLLSSDAFAPRFVVEMETNSVAQLRFGDGVYGRKPSAGTNFTATFRVGGGTQGNIGRDTLAHAVTSVGIKSIRNPLPAQGGVDPETLEKVRLSAPHAFRTQERAVTEADYAAAAQRHPDVQRAAATRRWTGSWYTMFVTVDRKGGRPVDADFEIELRAFLERFRLAGHDLEIDAPRFVPLDIAMTVCVLPDFFASDVKRELMKVFSNAAMADGTQGFFHPDNYTFGQPVYLSQVVATAMSVPGVHFVDMDDTAPKLNLFRRLGEESRGELQEGRITFDRLEIARLDNDPSARENGQIEFFMLGGL